MRPAPERIAGFPTHVTRAGRGVRRALFLHCTLAHSGAWTGVQARLLDKLSMTAFDRPGHGKSAPWASGDAAALHAQTTRTAAALIDRRADVIGHSFGATVALRLALEHPELVRSLVLIEPPLFPAVADSPEFAAHAEMMAAFGAALGRGDKAAAARIFHDSVNPDQPFAALPEPTRARLVAGVEVVAAEGDVVMADAAGLLAPGRLEGLRLPILMIEGSETTALLRATQAALAARMPGAARAVVVGAGHMAPLTHPENVAGEIAAFLKV